MKYPYELYENSSILLSDVAIPQLPPEIAFEGQRLFVKDEFHITLVSARYLAKMIDPRDEDAVTNHILREFEKFIKTTPLDKYNVSKDLRFAKTDKEKTIIVMAEVPDLNKFFERLSQKFSLELPVQQTHVTLYRYPKDFIGIPIPSSEILESITTPITMPQLGQLSI